MFQKTNVHVCHCQRLNRNTCLYYIIMLYHTSTDFSLYKSKLLKLARSLENDYHPEKGVIVEKTAKTQFCEFLTFHCSAHFLVNSPNTIVSPGCFFLCSSRHDCTKNAYEDMRPRGCPSALFFGMIDCSERPKRKICEFTVTCWKNLGSVDRHIYFLLFLINTLEFM